MYAGRFIPHINIGNLSTKNRRRGVKSKHFFEDVLQSDVSGCMKSTTFFFWGGVALKYAAYPKMALSEISLGQGMIRLTKPFEFGQTLCANHMVGNHRWIG